MRRLGWRPCVGAVSWRSAPGTPYSAAVTALFLRSALLTDAGVPHAFSLRVGGVSAAPYDSLNLGKAVGDDLAAVDENLSRLFAALGLDRAQLATVNQVHGNIVVTASRSGVTSVDGQPLSDRIDADAIIAEEGRIAGVRTADCVPILLHDRRTGISAAVHAGWRGTVDRIVSHTVDAMQRRHGVRPPELLAVIGPRIGHCCFEVGDDLATRFETDVTFGRQTIGRSVAGRPTVDLALANQRLLSAVGVTSVDVLNHCNSCAPELFFSHRRDAGRTGRHLAVIAGARLKGAT